MIINNKIINNNNDKKLIKMIKSSKKELFLYEIYHMILIIKIYIEKCEKLVLLNI